MNYIDYVIENTSLRQRTLSGLGLKITSARMRIQKDEEIIKQAKAKFKEISSMSDEEFLNSIHNLKNK